MVKWLLIILYLIEDPDKRIKDGVKIYSHKKSNLILVLCIHLKLNTGDLIVNTFKSITGLI